MKALDDTGSIEVPVHRFMARTLDSLRRYVE